MLSVILGFVEDLKKYEAVSAVNNRQSSGRVKLAPGEGILADEVCC